MPAEDLSSNEMTIAVAQFAGVTDVNANLATIERLAMQAARLGAGLMVCPEAAMFSFSASGAELAQVAERAGSFFEAEVCGIASRTGLTIVAGMYTKGPAELSRNTFIVASAGGEILARYDKLHLYDAFHYRESDKNQPGPLQDQMAELCTFEVGGLRFGLLNCYDLRFPEMARALVDRDLDALLVGAGWIAGPLKELHWETLLRARAIENTCYVAGSCQPPPLSVGMSMLVDPSGLVLGTVADTEGVAVGTVRRARLAEVREVLPCLKHRRYAIVQRRP
ncbi:carbon-nitrogen hydrolase family protein [Enterovirga sp. CN4-39]|uniref:carbon-nitrogen hydrolase family protein n=1 Tax=Enterovirga sp. CN4-39 TaxID=3400910 RepID=UPI003C04B97E